MAPRPINTPLATDTNKKETMDKDIESLKNEASIQLNRLESHKKTMLAFQSNASILVKRHHVGESYFSQAATWHGSGAWWFKLGLAITVIGLAAGIGAALAMPLIFATVTFVLYSIIVLLLENHYAVVERSDKRLVADIVALEQSLADSVEHLSAIEDSLKIVLTSLCKMNIQQAKDIAEFELQIDRLSMQVHVLTAITTQLEQTRDSLVENTAKMGKSFEATQLNLTQLTQGLADELTTLNQTDHLVIDTTSFLMQGQISLNAVSGQFHQDSTQLSMLTNQLSRLLCLLKQHAEDDRAVHDATRLKLSTSVDKTLEARTNADETIAHTDETIASALKMLNDHEAEQTLMGKNMAHQMSAHEERTAASNEALARVAHLLTPDRTNTTSGNASFQ